MNEPTAAPVPAPVLVLVIDDDAVTGRPLVEAVERVLGDAVTVELVTDADGAADAARQRPTALVPVVVIDGDRDEASETAIAVHDLDELGAARTVLVTAGTSLRGFDLALRRGAIHGMITRPWSDEGLAAQLEANLATFLLQHAPERFDEFASILDSDTHDRARERLRQQQAATTSASTSTPLLLDATISDEEVERRMIELLDRALGHPPRIRVAAGTVMIESGDDVGGIYVLLEGTVKLSSTTSTGERILHQQSTGAIIGLLSLASHRRAMLQCRAVSEVRAIPVTLTQLARALDSEPELSSLLTRVLVTSLARRLRRSDELQVELDQSLSDLSEARAQLVATTRFATLGELAAGMAHELNNPTAALVRSADHLHDDLAALLEPSLMAVVDRRLTEDVPSPSALRALKRQLAKEDLDPTLTQRLVDAGYTDPDNIRAAASSIEPDRAIASSRLGRSLRTLMGAATQIQELVASLRSYLRAEDGRGPLATDVDLVATIDDAFRLLEHRLSGVAVTREFASVPPVTGRPGALQQVWTNLVVNAVEALETNSSTSRELTISVDLDDRADPTRPMVEVHVIDNGPGIPPDLIEQIFEPRFTTKHGRVEFGLGLGLSISRQIIEDHGGWIGVNSRPGHTDMTVTLPVEGAS